MQDVKLKLQLRILLNQDIAFGPGKAELLEEIRRTGSISQAAKSMNMSYRRAWQLVETMNHSFQSGLVETQKGGTHGGGAKLTDLGESILSQFLKHAKVPIISLESATRHPLQSLADCIAITENWTETRKPKVVLTWAPHIKAIAQAVGNSFTEWMQEMNVDFVIANPEGYDLDKNFTKDTPVIHNQDEALKDADFVYVKNWSSFDDYAKVLEVEDNWMLTNEKLELTNQAKVMHCLPVRRNLELSDEVMDGENSIIYQQAKNRIFSAQTVFSEILDELNKC